MGQHILFLFSDCFIFVFGLVLTLVKTGRNFFVLGGHALFLPFVFTLQRIVCFKR